MSMTWLSGFERKPMKAGGTYDSTATPKLGWHTWEGTSWSSAESAFTRYPPHIGVMPPYPGKTAGKRQYVPLDRCAYAFAGSENDDEYIIQVEVAGFAADTYKWSDEVCRWLGEEVVRPIAEATGVPPIIVPAGFHDTRTYRARNPANYLASTRSELRMTADQLRRFSGHVGHQHMPPPDSHWDPGNLPLDRILSFSKGTTPQPPPEEDPAMIARCTAYTIVEGWYRLHAGRADGGYSDKGGFTWWVNQVKAAKTPAEIDNLELLFFNLSRPS